MTELLKKGAGLVGLTLGPFALVLGLLSGFVLGGASGYGVTARVSYEAGKRLGAAQASGACKEAAKAAEAEIAKREAAAAAASLQQSKVDLAASEERLKGAEQRAEHYARYVKAAGDVQRGSACAVNAEWLRARDAGKTAGESVPPGPPPSRPRPAVKASR